MGLTVTVLGSSGGFATAERACAGYLIEIDQTRLWLDAGAGTWQNLLSYVDYPDLDAIVLTHRHVDHVTDVFQAFHARLFGEVRPVSKIPLWAPQQTIDGLVAFDDELHETFEIAPIQEGASLDLAGARLSFVRMAHPPVTLGVRIEHGASVFAYSADSGPAADFRALAGDADLFVCEASLQDSDRPWKGHLSATQVGAIASDVSAKRAVLTHLFPGKDHGLSIAQAQKTSGEAEVQLAADGLRIEL